MWTRLRGADGESKAARYLIKKGYKVIASGYHSRFGEIDLIAKKGDLVVFTEVKTRKNDRFAKAFEAVDSHKIDRIQKTAQMWMSQNDKNYNYRFDVIEVYTETGVINHIENAF